MQSIPFGELRRRLEEGPVTAAGVLSGTSADGIDVAIVELVPDAAPRQLAFRTSPFPPDVGQRVRKLLERGRGAPTSARHLALLHRDLGRAFGEAVRELAWDSGHWPALVGSHGQTIYHHDDVEPTGGASLQIGDGDWVAAGLGATVVSDFRQADLAAGGTGAPLTPLADPLLFAHVDRPFAVLNLGGIANITLVGEERVLGWDVSPAGSLLDGLARRRLGRPYDEGGEVALTGRVVAELVERGLQSPFFERRPPKSTGRDTFGPDWIEGWNREEHASEDLLASACGFVAEAVRRSLGLAERQPGSLWVAGGGVHNQRLLDELAARLPCPVAPSSEVGVDPDAREALAFACLAAECVRGIGRTEAALTGARGGRVLGKISPAVG